MLTLKTPAKINLVLEVTGKRPDGYHEIKSIIQSISLYDELAFEEAAQIDFRCDSDAIPDDNLVTRAAMMLKDSQGYKSGAIIRLKKLIPVSAGLGGGSSDAAATLIGLNKLWKLNLDREILKEMAGKLGSDVPFFIQKGTALAEGRGEKIRQLPRAEGWVVLSLQAGIPINNKTSFMYSKLQPEDFTDGLRAEKLASDLCSRKKIDGSLTYNVFDRISREEFPPIAKGFALYKQVKGTDVHLAGAGPTLFSLCGNKNDAAKLIAALKNADPSGNYAACQFTDK